MKWLRERADPFVRKWIYRVYDKPKYADVMPRSLLDKILDWNMKILNFVLDIGVFISLIIAFNYFILPRIGFEKTIILLMLSMIALVRIFLEKEKEKKK